MKNDASYEWNFPSANHGKSTGYTATGVDDFLDEPVLNLTRESIQNSLDARKDNTKPVIVKFSTFKTNWEEFPGIASFFNTLNQWYQDVSKRENKNQQELDFVKLALQAIKRPEIAWLKISDFNTTGMRDIRNQNGGWQAFTKAAGNNQKQSDNAGGSKGQGKNALFANSIFKTIFACTHNDMNEVANIGIANFCSFEIGETDEYGQRDYTSGTGYCIEANNERKKRLNEFSEADLLIGPESAREDGNFGSDIYIPGFRYINGNWESQLIGEAILSFLPAIVDGDLVVIIEGMNYSRTISKSNIYTEVANPNNFDKIKDRDFVRNFYAALSQKCFRECNEAGYEMKLFVKTNDENENNKVVCYRFPTKMKIKYLTPSAQVSYSAVLLIEGTKLCKILRSVEDVKHSNWQVKRFIDSGFERNVVSDAVTKVNQFVTNAIGGLSLELDASSSDFEWTKDHDWLSDTDSNSLSLVSDGDELPSDEVEIESRLITAARKPRKKHGTVDDKSEDAIDFVVGKGAEGKGEGEGSHPDGHNKSDTRNEPHTGSRTFNVDEGDDKMMIRKPVSTDRCRMPSISPSKGLFKLLFKPNVTRSDVRISILKVGGDSAEEAAVILSASYHGKPLTIEKNKIVFGDIEKKKNYEIDITLADKRNYVWEVNVDAAV